MKRINLLIILISFLFLLCGCFKKNEPLLEVTMRGFNQLIVWDNPSNYEGFELTVNNSSTKIYTKLTYHVAEGSVQHISLRPYVTKRNKTVYGPTSTMENISPIVISNLQEVFLTNASNNSYRHIIPNETDYVIVKSNYPEISNDYLVIKTRNSPLKIFLSGINVETYSPFISFETPEENENIFVVIESTGEENSIKRLGLTTTQDGAIELPNIYLIGNTPITIEGRKGSNGNKGPDASLVMDAGDGCDGHIGGSSIKCDFLIINHQQTVTLVAGPGGAGGLGGNVSPALSAMGKTKGKSGANGADGKHIDARFSHSIISGELIFILRKNYPIQ